MERGRSEGAFFLARLFGQTYVVVSTLLSAAVILVIVLLLVRHSAEAVSQIGWEALRTVWDPARGAFGLVPMLYGTLAVTAIAITIAVPLGVLTALFTSEILRGRPRLYVKSFLELLAGIPSIVYGLLGVAFLSVWIGDWFALQSGRTLLTAGLLLAVMVLPTVITLSDDALHNVPVKYREAAGGLGLYKYEIIKEAVLPLARMEIAGAVLLALGRALGETMAVMLVVGSIDRLPSPLFNLLTPGQTITSKLGREIAEAAFGSLHFSALILIGTVLLIIVLLLTTLALLFFHNPERRLHE